METTTAAAPPAVLDLPVLGDTPVTYAAYAAYVAPVLADSVNPPGLAESSIVLEAPVPDVAVADASVVPDDKKPPTRLTLVISHSDKKKTSKKKSKGPTTAELDDAPKKKESVVKYANPREHFVLRAYRQLNSMVSSNLMNEVRPLLEKLDSTSHCKICLLDTGKRVESKETKSTESKNETTESKEDLLVKNPRDKMSKFVNQLFDDLQTSEILISDIVSKLTKEMDTFKTNDFINLALRVLRAPATQFTTSEDTFLDDPTLSFYIFREARRTTYVIKNDKQWTSMVQHAPTLFCGCGHHGRKPQPKPNNDPVTQTEIKHMRSCYIRWQRGKSRRDLPVGFVEDHKSVRRLATIPAPRPQK